MASGAKVLLRRLATADPVLLCTHVQFSSGKSWSDGAAATWQLMFNFLRLEYIGGYGA